MLVFVNLQRHLQSDSIPLKEYLAFTPNNIRVELAEFTGERECPKLPNVAFTHLLAEYPSVHPPSGA